MFGTARHVLFQHYARKRRQSEEDLGSRSVLELAPGPRSMMARRREQRIFLEALRRLPLDYQIAIELHDFEDLTGPEIAAVLEVPEGTVRSRLRRARLQLEERIRQLDDSPEVLESTLTRLDEWAVDVRGLLSPGNEVK